jgi:hypothetical protein
LTPCLTLNGSGGQAVTSRPVMGNGASFSVSAWVNPSGCAATRCTVLSQGGNTVSAFTLGYQPSGSVGTVSQCPCWVFAMPAQDSSTYCESAWQDGASLGKACVPYGVM